VFRKLVSFDEARLILRQSFAARPVGLERVPISKALDRVLAEDVLAPMDVPPFDRSTVDGYAVKAVDTFGADEDRPIALEFCGQVNVGESPRIVVEEGMTAEIVTGAPLPDGADAVVMVEYSVRKNETILLRSPVSKGENVMEAGSDIHEGEKILGEGQKLTSREIGVLAALGLTEVAVYLSPKIAVISTGAEVVEPGKPLLQGKIYDVNARTISAAVVECGGKPISFGIIQDDRDQLEAAINEALNSADVVITSGGVSVGPKDVIPKILAALGDPGLIVSGIAIKPGKPTNIAVVNGKPVFSLPGHPTSSLMAFYMIVRPIILGMAGRNEEPTLTVTALAATKMFSARGRRTFVMVNLNRDETGLLLASPVPTGLSGAITTLAKADGFVEIEEKKQFVNEGKEVTVHLFHGSKY
jgi:putative molybdopterin biosynthesis protein